MRHTPRLRWVVIILAHTRHRLGGGALSMNSSSQVCTLPLMKGVGGEDQLRHTHRWDYRYSRGAQLGPALAPGKHQANRDGDGPEHSNILISQRCFSHPW